MLLGFGVEVDESESVVVFAEDGIRCGGVANDIIYCGKI